MRGKTWACWPPGMKGGRKCSKEASAGEGTLKVICMGPGKWMGTRPDSLLETMDYTVNPHSHTHKLAC